MPDIPRVMTVGDDLCANFPGLRVTFDGVPQRYVMSYNMDTGELVRFVVDREGKFLRNPLQPDEFLTQTVYGKVQAHA